MGEKPSTKKAKQTPLGFKCGFKNYVSAFLSVVARKEYDYNVFSL